MPFPSALSAPQKTTLRTSGYWQRTFIAFNPGEVVFQCESDEAIDSAPFAEFAWTNTLQGAYTDVLAGMVVFISATTDVKNFKYRGRVRLAPSATEFRIDLNATTLEVGDIITVIRDADLFSKVRNDTFIDADVAYHNLPPMITGLPSVLCLYDSDNDGSVSFAFTQSGLAVASGATISAWLWTISGAGTTAFTVGSSTSQNPTIQFQAGFHYLLRCRVTDSNSVQHFVFCQVYAVTRTFAAPVILPAVAGSVSQDLENGYSGSVTAYGGVANLPYRTHAAVFCVERFGDNTSTPMATNVLMHGRLRSENITTEGSDEAGVLQQVTYPIEGITSYLQRLKVPNDVVRHVASPNKWGEMVNPTPFRLAVYFLYAYSTLLNLVSFSAGDSLFDAWRRGGEPVSIDGGMALDALKSILDMIKGAPNYAPDGEIRCEINASYRVDRSALVTVMDFLPGDTTRLAVDVDTSKSTGQVVGTGGSWHTVSNTFFLFTASAPTIPYGDNPETRELTRELLEYDNTTTESAGELAARTGNDYAFNNPKLLASASLIDSHRWLVATNYQRYTWTMTTAENLRELVLTTATKFQCQRVNITINTDGTFDPDADFVEETSFTDAQSIASQLPGNIPQLNPVLPVLSDDPAFPDEPLWMYPTDTPTQEELQPIGSDSAYLSYSPFTPDQAAAAAAKQGTVNCRTLQHYMRNGGTTFSTWLTVAAAAYTIKVSGSGQINNSTVLSDDLFSGLGPNTSQLGASFPFGVWCDGDIFTVACLNSQKGGAWNAAGGNGGGGCIQGEFIDRSTGRDLNQAGVVLDLGAEFTVTEVMFWYAVTAVDGSATGQNDIRFWDAAKVEVGTRDTTTPIPSTTYHQTYWAETPRVGVRYVSMNAVYDPDNPTVSKMKIDDISVRYIDPAGEPQFADWLYKFTPGDDNSSTLFDPAQGGLLDGNKPALIPAYNPAHEYFFPYTGTGFTLGASFVLDSYTEVANNIFTIQACLD